MFGLSLTEVPQMPPPPRPQMPPPSPQHKEGEEREGQRRHLLSFQSLLGLQATNLILSSALLFLPLLQFQFATWVSCGSLSDAKVRVKPYEGGA